MLKISKILVEYEKEPMGLDIENPGFTWMLESDDNGTGQISYSIKVLDDDEIMWDSGVVDSDRTSHVCYKGKPLQPETAYDVIIVSKDNNGNSATGRTCFETGIGGKFQASWITHCLPEDEEACPVFIRNFSANSDIEEARLYITTLGIYDAYINGNRISDTYFNPGWTSYNKRLQYQTYDITGSIKEGNEISVTVAKGWYRGNIAFRGRKNFYGDKTALLMEIHLTYSDGTRKIIGSDDEFICCTGPVRYSEFYHGEIQDKNVTSMDTHKAVIYDYPKDMIVSAGNDPVKITETLPAIDFIETPAGEKVIDFGQNIAGFVEFDCDLPKGTEITIRHAEVLDLDGNFYTENLRAAKCTDRFICSGVRETLRPRFTFHGFRYICIEGIGEVDISKFRACVLHTDMRPTGSFECSDELINKLQQNIQWGQRGNFIDIPTDCPQRDERLGWTGDAQVFCSTAAYNFDVARFLAKWLCDLAADQGRNGSVPNVVPDVLTERGKEPGNSTAWGDAAVIIPWEMYKRYGDVRYLEKQYESMKAWVEYISREAGNAYLWTEGTHFGDWLALDMEQYYTYRSFSANSATGATDKDYIATAFFARSTELLYRSAEVLDYKNDISKYKKLHERIIEAFRLEYVTPNGRLMCETQTGMLLALKFNLIEGKQRNALLQRLVSNIKRHNNQMVTGFVGVAYLCPVLSENGYHELAGELLMQKEYPSWLYPVTKGATTIWERWNGIKPDGSFADPAMNSFNHYAYGAIGAWMYEYILGIRPAEPGYAEILIKPMPIKGIDFARGHYESICGRTEVSWKLVEGVMHLDAVIPANCSARIVFPGKNTEIKVGSGDYHFEEKIGGALC